MRYVNRPNCLPARNLGDSSSIKSDEVIAKYQQRVERIYAKVRNASIEYMHENQRTYDAKQAQKDFYGSKGKVGEIFSLDIFKGLACTIPDTIQYKEVVGTKTVVVTKNCHELYLERLALLDIIKKSQQQEKRRCSWGEVQTIKRFTRNAKQKILEAGAVIDKHVGSTNAYEVTLTIPGSGFDVYDVVSRYSGYMVNRMTQIIRRAEAKGVEVYWFFVWEHQKRGALHMHWCLAVKGNRKIANLLGLEIRSKWFELLEELSVKTGIDLFKKRGFSGTWRHSPEKWQARVTRVRKSVAAYFSKYCSKNVGTSGYNQARRQSKARLSDWHPPKIYKHGVISLCPSRYWGSASRVKRLCAYYRVTISFAVANSGEGDFIYKAIREWLSKICGELKEVSRNFEKADPKTDFIYASGWEKKIWFDKEYLDDILRLYRRIFSYKLRKIDAIGAIADLLSC